MGSFGSAWRHPAKPGVKERSRSRPLRFSRSGSNRSAIAGRSMPPAGSLARQAASAPLLRFLSPSAHSSHVALVGPGTPARLVRTRTPCQCPADPASALHGALAVFRCVCRTPPTLLGLRSGSVRHPSRGRCHSPPVFFSVGVPDAAAHSARPLIALIWRDPALMGFMPFAVLLCPQVIAASSVANTPHAVYRRAIPGIFSRRPAASSEALCDRSSVSPPRLLGLSPRASRALWAANCPGLFLFQGLRTFTRTR